MSDGQREALERLGRRVDELARELTDVRRELAQLQSTGEKTAENHQPAGSGATVSARSEPRAKIELYLERFVGRRDVYAQRWTSRKTGKSGWSPAVRGGFYSRDTPLHDHLPLTPEVIDAHLRVGGPHAGLYVMLPGDVCQLLVCDFDDGSWREDAAAYVAACREHGVDALTEISRSGEGAHVWIFFTEPVPAVTARALGFRLLREVMQQRPQMELESYDRFFPAQDTLSTKARGKARLGNLIALPLNGDCRGRGTTIFADADTWEPLEDQFAALADVEPVTPSRVEELAQSSGRVFGPKPERLRRPTRAEVRVGREAAKGTVVSVEVDNVVHLPVMGLSGSVLSELKHRASLPNPEFYRRQAQRFSTFGVPRVVVRFDHDDTELRLPRGLVENVQEVLGEAGFTAEVSWPSPAGPAMDVPFRGELRSVQSAAVNAVSGHHTGVIVAPPGTGKTVMACALIAQRGVSTAVIVNRAELVNQWRERLTEFLDLPESDIGQLGSGRRKLKGKVDLIMLQSISRKDSDPLVLEDYGQVIVDECHNIAAPAAEGDLNQISVPYWLGLTATPFRSDKMDEIITMQCGPVRHRMDVDVASEQRYVKIHRTEFETDADTGERGAIQDVYNELAEDEQRNRFIVEQVVPAVAEGRRCLVLVNRLAALESLVDLLRGAVDSPVLEMHGRQKAAVRADVRSELDALGSQDKPYVLVAMGKVAGEGFDVPSLNTLFLAAPVSFKGVVIQQTGRITRAVGTDSDSPEAGPSEAMPAIVHDFVDDRVPVLTRMHGRRLRAMEKEGFEVVDQGS